MNKVYITKCTSYHQEEVRQSLIKLLVENNLLDFIKKGLKVGIKVNLVSNLKPELAATTHNVLVYELCKILLEKEAIVTVGDSPGGLFTESFLKHVYKETKMDELIPLGVKLNYNTSTCIKQVEGKVVKHLDISSWLLEQDVIINFSKLKSHGMMALSASVKNMFGTVPGILKPEYHYRYPNHEDFANMLIDINDYYHPVLNIIDGVVGMEGNGPTQGEPRKINVLMACKTPYELDFVAAKIIGLKINDVPTIKESIKRSYLSQNFNDLELSNPINEFIISDFKNILPGKNMEFSEKFKGKFGKVIAKAISKILTVRPKVTKKECIGCKKCANICPAHAIVMKNKIPHIDKNICIRCFCCQEFCPVGAMKTHKNNLVKLLTKSK